MSQELVLVNEQDEQTGTGEKMKVHREGLLHRAFSVFVFNRDGQMMLQRRSLSKYHSGGLWTNACCSHPAPGEDVESAAGKRLVEEMGFSTSLQKVFDFVYKAGFGNGMTEHEFDHVFVGQYDGPVDYNREEVMDYCYQSMDELKESIRFKPEVYTEWFKLAFPRIETWWLEHFKNK
ncbi:MAG: isopentenyl-diphosphate Delta-isomerase [Chitinophagaceae bacterium]|nr:MAG: isopentenyl-diphosphate Delta-isomerase [Chitinophagaceae bacterium]